MKRGTKVLLIGCSGFVVLAIAAMIWLGVWLFSGPVGGVKLVNQMDQYALGYIAEHNLLAPGEELVAYYDATTAMDGTEAAILSTDRVIYHKLGNTMAIPIREIEEVRHSYETLSGDIIEIQARSGQVMRIEIAPFNLGETFNSVLETAVERAKVETDGG